ncbi:MAG: hypothetical protein PHQ40_22060, partial [Anaerolineaceae bacterium]|nr:hypothetical protein [Anaerolineaceae bacterium]
MPVLTTKPNEPRMGSFGFDRYLTQTSVSRLRLYQFRDHPFQNHFKGHCMAAAPAGMEEIAVAIPYTVFILDGMGIILSIHRDCKGIEMDPVALVGVAFGLLDLTNHPIIHDLLLLSCVMRIKNGTRRYARAYNDP